MEYNIACFVEDFAKRTKKNLAAIEKMHAEEMKKNNGIINDVDEAMVFEVTQLINSLLGLLIIPQQAINAVVKESEKEKEEKKLLSHEIIKSTYIRDLIEKLKNEERLYHSVDRNNMWEDEFIRHLRNAIAHPDKGIHFFPLSKGRLRNGQYTRDTERREEIGYIYFYDKADVEFCVKLSLEEIKELTDDFSQLVCDLIKRHKEERKIVFEYHTHIEYMDDLLQSGN